MRLELSCSGKSETSVLFEHMFFLRIAKGGMTVELDALADFPAATQLVSLIRQRTGAFLIILFGSYAKGLARGDSDIDIAYAGEQTLSAYDNFMLAQELLRCWDVRCRLIGPVAGINSDEGADCCLWQGCFLFG